MTREDAERILQADAKQDRARTEMLRSMHEMQRLEFLVAMALAFKEPSVEPLQLAA
jgi:hypothetical protein